jgi:hypothetical protein
VPAMLMVLTPETIAYTSGRVGEDTGETWTGVGVGLDEVPAWAWEVGDVDAAPGVDVPQAESRTSNRIRRRTYLKRSARGRVMRPASSALSRIDELAGRAGDTHQFRPVRTPSRDG